MSVRFLVLLFKSEKCKLIFYSVYCKYLMMAILEQFYVICYHYAVIVFVILNQNAMPLSLFIYNMPS